MGMEKSNISLAIIEDDKLIRLGLEKYFSNQPEFDKVLAVESVEAFFSEVGDRKVNVVLTDIGLPGKSGIEGIKMIKEKYASVDVIMITVFKDSDKIFQSLCAGAAGYILKGTPFDDIKESVLTILGGGSYMSPTIARKVVEYFNPSKKRPESKLTSREEQIVKCLVDGLSYKLIANRLSLSIDTVRYHIKNIYSKLQVNSKSEVISKSLRGEL